MRRRNQRSRSGRNWSRFSGRGLGRREGGTGAVPGVCYHGFKCHSVLWLCRGRSFFFTPAYQASNRSRPQVRRAAFVCLFVLVIWWFFVVWKLHSRCCSPDSARRSGAAGVPARRRKDPKEVRWGDRTYSSEWRSTENTGVFFKLFYFLAPPPPPPRYSVNTRRLCS